MEETKTPLLIELILSNTDSIEFEAKHITSMYIGGITENRVITQDTCLLFKEAENIQLTICNKANVEYTEFGHNKAATKKFERIQRQADICAINIKYNDATQETINVKWHENDEYINRYQKAYLDENYNFIIEISKTHETNTIKNTPVKTEPVVVTVSYSFDESTDAYIFDTYEEAIYQIQNDYESELANDKELGKDIAEDKCYCMDDNACLSYYTKDGELMQTFWNVSNVIDNRKGDK